MYDLSPNTSRSIVKKFKESHSSNDIMFEGKTSNSMLQIDSAIWLLEATLNHDFDFNRTNEVALNHTIFYSVSHTNLEISSANLYNVFLNLSNQTTSLLAENQKVSVIDVSAHVENDNIVFVSQVSTFVPAPKEKLPPCFCCDYTTQTAEWYTWGNATGCNGLPDGPNMVMTKLACSYDTPACLGGTFYTNVVTTVFNNSSNSYSGSLYYKYYPNTACDNTILYAYMLNGYKTGCMNLATTNIPTSPSGEIITNMVITAVPAVSNPPVHYWTLSVTYGVPNC